VRADEKFINCGKPSLSFEKHGACAHTHTHTHTQTREARASSISSCGITNFTMNGAIVHCTWNREEENQILEISTYNLSTDCFLTFNAESTPCRAGEVKQNKIGLLAAHHVADVKFIFASCDKTANALRPLLGRDVFALDFLCQMPRMEEIVVAETECCALHKENAVAEISVCARIFVHAMKNFVKDKIDEINLMDSKVRMKTFVNFQIDDLDPVILSRFGFVYRTTLPLDTTIYRRCWLSCVGCTYSCTDFAESRYSIFEHKKQGRSCPFNNTVQF
jgi:hypothetical protein